MELIDRSKLEPDAEWDDYYDDYMSYSAVQIKNAPIVKAVPSDKIKKVREEIQELAEIRDSDTLADLRIRFGLGVALAYIDKLIAESEGKNE